MRVIRSDGSVDTRISRSEQREKNLKDVWDSLEGKGLQNPMKANFRGIKELVRRKRNDT